MNLIYVNPSGDDGNDGSYDNPYETLQGAVGNSGTDLLIVMQDGDYTGTQNLCQVTFTNNINGVVAENPGEVNLGSIFLTDGYAYLWEIDSGVGTRSKDKFLIKGIKFYDIETEGTQGEDIVGYIESNYGLEMESCEFDNLIITEDNLIKIDNSDCKIINCVFNDITVGEILISTDVELDMSNVIFQGIIANYIVEYNGDKFELKNSIVYNNTLTGYIDLSNSAKFSIHHTLIPTLFETEIDGYDILEIDLPAREEFLVDTDPLYSSGYYLGTDSEGRYFGDDGEDIGIYKSQSVFNPEQPTYNSALSKKVLEDNFRYLDMFMQSGRASFKGGGGYVEVRLNKIDYIMRDFNKPNYRIEDDEYKEVLHDYNIFIQVIGNDAVGDYYVEKVDENSFKVYNSGTEGEFFWTIGDYNNG